MCEHCGAVSMDVQVVLASMFMTGVEFTRDVHAGRQAKATEDMGTYLTDLLDDMHPDAVKALMGTLILMSLDELRPVFERVRRHYAQTN